MNTAVFLCTSMLLTVVFSPPALEARATSNQLEVFLNSLEAKEQQKEQEQPNLKRYDENQADSPQLSNDAEALMKEKTRNIEPARITQHLPILDHDVTIKSYGGDKYYPDFKYLNGNTGDGEVNLVPNYDYPYTGAVWRPEYLNDGTYAFRCLGDYANPDHVYLDGHTGDGSVSLSPSTDYPYTGTHWNIWTVWTEPGRTIYALGCAGHDYNPDHVFLRGELDANNINAGTVYLYSTYNWIEAQWIFEIY